jgi:hypothetical protein
MIQANAQRWMKTTGIKDHRTPPSFEAALQPGSAQKVSVAQDQQALAGSFKLF